MNKEHDVLIEAEETRREVDRLVKEYRAKDLTPDAVKQVVTNRAMRRRMSDSKKTDSVMIKNGKKSRYHRILKQNAAKRKRQERDIIEEDTSKLIVVKNRSDAYE